MTPSPDAPRHSALGELILAGLGLTCAVALALPFTLWWGDRFAGREGMLASAAAAGLCWLGSVLAAAVRVRYPKPQEVVVGTLGAMLVRMVLILGGALLISELLPVLKQAAFLGQVVIYFLLTLAVETALAVRWVKKLEASAAKPAGEESAVPDGSMKAV